MIEACKGNTVLRELAKGQEVLMFRIDISCFNPFINICKAFV